MSFLFALAFVALLILKVLGYITCSWWIVTMPLWIGAIVGIVIMSLVFTGIVGTGVLVMLWSEFRKK
jgi:hypothetical protein